MHHAEVPRDTPQVTPVDILLHGAGPQFGRVAPRLGLRRVLVAAGLAAVALTPGAGRQGRERDQV
jgi:hypothetical protein